MDNSVKNRIKQINTLFVATPQLQQILNDIKRVRDVAEITNYTMEPDCILVTGEPGVGKTTLIEKYVNAHPREEYEDYTHIPVVASCLPTVRTGKALGAQLLYDLGDPLEGKQGDAKDLANRFYAQAKAARTQIAFLDEFHHSIQTQSFTVVRDVADYIKVLINRTKIPVVLFGLPWSDYIFEVNPELKRRFTIVHELRNFTLKDFKTFQNFVYKVQEKLPIAVEKDLWRVELAFRLFAASEGNISKLVKMILRPAATETVIGGEDCLTIRQLAAVSRKNLKLHDSLNPFLIDLSDIKALQQERNSRWDRGVKRGQNPLIEPVYKAVKYEDLNIDALGLEDIF